MSLNIDEFEDIHQHASSVREWQQIYSQLTAGPLRSSLCQIRNARLHVFRERINQRVVQHGEAPRGRVCFAVPLLIPGSIQMQGRDADDASIFVLRGGEEFMFHMPMGMDMLAITFDEALFEQAVSVTGCRDEIDTLLKQPVVRVPIERLATSRRRLMAMFSEAAAESALPAPPDGVELHLEQAMLDELVGLIADPACDRAQQRTSSVRSFIVEKCHRMTISDTVNAPSVVELCERLRISRRTMQNSFRTVADTTPVHYIRSIRLNGVRRELMSTCAPELSIGDAAARWGFFHLSHFAADYHELFGELPSQTKRRQRPADR